jgi:FtsZ-binding cell division protein ZapB
MPTSENELRDMKRRSVMHIIMNQMAYQEAVVCSRTVRGKQVRRGLLNLRFLVHTYLRYKCQFADHVAQRQAQRAEKLEAEVKQVALAHKLLQGEYEQLEVQNQYLEGEVQGLDSEVKDLRPRAAVILKGLKEEQLHVVRVDSENRHVIVIRGQAQHARIRMNLIRRAFQLPQETPPIPVAATSGGGQHRNWRGVVCHHPNSVTQWWVLRQELLQQRKIKLVDIIKGDHKFNCIECCEFTADTLIDLVMDMHRRCSQDDKEHELEETTSDYFPPVAVEKAVQ